MENLTLAKGIKFPPAPAVAKTTTKAFTLVELLVTVLILAILMTMLVGGVRYALESAKSASCMGNLRTLGTGFASYAAENNNLFPNFAQGGFWPARIAEYVPRKAFFCPAENKAAVANRVGRDDNAWRDNQPIISYGYNYRYLAPDFGSSWSVPRDRDDITFSRISRMSSVMLLADAGRLNSTRKSGWGFYVMEPPWMDYSMPLPRHHGRANVLWTDGSVSARQAILETLDGYKYITRENWDWNLQ